MGVVYVELLKPRNSILSLKGLTLIASCVIATAGAITLWATLDGDSTAISYASGILFLMAFINLAGFVWALPLAYALMAVLFFVTAPLLIDSSDQLRRLPNRNDDQRAAMAGMIILLFGAALSFCCIPTRFNWYSWVDVFMVGVVAVFCIIGGVILANIVQRIYAAQVFIVLFIFYHAVLHGYRSLMYVSLVLSAILFVTLLPFAFPTGQAKKVRVGFVIAWIGQLLTMLWAFICLAILRKEEDLFLAVPVDKPVATAVAPVVVAESKV